MAQFGHGDRQRKKSKTEEDGSYHTDHVSPDKRCSLCGHGFVPPFTVKIVLGYILLLGTFVNSSRDKKINIKIVQNCGSQFLAPMKNRRFLRFIHNNNNNYHFHHQLLHTGFLGVY